MTHDELIENEIDTEILQKQDNEEIEKLEVMLDSHDHKDQMCNCSPMRQRLAELQN